MKYGLEAARQTIRPVGNTDNFIETLFGKLHVKFMDFLQAIPPSDIRVNPRTLVAVARAVVVQMPRTLRLPLLLSFKNLRKMLTSLFTDGLIVKIQLGGTPVLTFPPGIANR